MSPFFNDLSISFRYLATYGEGHISLYGRYVVLFRFTNKCVRNKRTNCVKAGISKSHLFANTVGNLGLLS